MNVSPKAASAVTVFVFLVAAGSLLHGQDPQQSARTVVGKFEVWKNLAVLHDVELLPDGTYKMDDRRGKAIGQGTYTFDARSSKVTWTSGPYKDANYAGILQSEHKIRVSARSYAVNTNVAGSGNNAPALGTYIARDAAIFFTLLPGGKYKTYNLIDQKLFGEGSYTYDPKQRAVTWTSGHNKDRGYYTAFTVEQRIVLDAKDGIRAERVLK